MIYTSTDSLPQSLALFPLSGALLLPHGQLPLNIFEPRYLEMVNHVLGAERMIGMIQPKDGAHDTPTPALYDVGCAGRIMSFSEADDGERMIISLTGICRFRIAREIPADTPYRQALVDYAPFANDLKKGLDEDKVDRAKLLDVLRRYLTRNELNADWEAIDKTPNEMLVTVLSTISPYGPREKQALLEARSVVERNEILIALTEMALAQGADDKTKLQ